MPEQTVTPDQIIHFWFEEIEPAQWWVKDLEFDREIEARFGVIHEAATLGELEPWRKTAEGRLAEIILLDQFSRNIYRGRPLTFAYDATALVLAQEAVRVGADREVDFEKRSFFYMPYMHSESPKVHKTAVVLFGQPGAEFNYEFELKHKAIIDYFGRYPHRNAILGRESTAEEVEFLTQPDSSF
jgi:uncharacterized protein (DUF924 family)